MRRSQAEMILLYVSMNGPRMDVLTWQFWHRMMAYPVPSFVTSILLRIELRTAKSSHEADSIPNRSNAKTLRTRIHWTGQLKSDGTESVIQDFYITGLTADLQCLAEQSAKGQELSRRLGYAGSSLTDPTVSGNPAQRISRETVEGH